MKDPETQKAPKFISLVIEAVVFACLQDTEEQEAAKAKAPKHNEERVNDLTRMMCTAECKSDNGEYNKVGSASEICDCVSVDLVSGGRG